ncbi:MAG: hypothetical protein ACOC2J_01920 [bacterium]
MNKKDLKKFFLEYMIWLLIIILLLVNFRIIKYYTNGTYYSFMPIAAINLAIIILWVTFLYKNPSGKGMRLLNKLLVISVLALLILVIVIYFTNSSDLDDLIEIEFDNENVSFRSDIAASPLSPDRTINISFDMKDKNVIMDYDSSQELIHNNGLYYKRGRLAPFSGVYYKIDNEREMIKEGSSYLIGELLQKQIYEDNFLKEDIYYRRSSRFGHWENTRSKKLIYNSENNQRTITYYDTDGVKTEELIYVDDVKVKELDYDDGILTHIKVYDEYVEAYHDDGHLRFRGEMVEGYLWGDVIAYYDTGQIKYEGNFPRISDVSIDSRIARTRTNFSPDYRNKLFVLSGINTSSIEDEPGVVNLSISGSEIMYDDSWYSSLEETPDGFLESSENQQNQVGDWVYYYENGEVQAKGSYYRGFPVDEWEYYYDNGQLEAKGCYFEPGIKGGYWEYYYRNGQLKSKGYFAEPDEYEIETALFSTSVLDNPLNVFNESLKHDIWEYYSANGELMARGRYLNGEKVGQWQIWDIENDSLVIEEYKEINEEILSELIEINGKGYIEIDISDDGQVRLTAIPEEGWEFLKWGGVLDSTSQDIITNLENKIIVYFDYSMEHDKPAEDGYFLAVKQNGRKIEIIENEVFLEKKAFEFEISFVDEILVLVQASFEDDLAKKIEEGLEYENTTIAGGRGIAVSEENKIIYLRENVNNEFFLQHDFHSYYPISYTRKKTVFSKVVDLGTYKIGTQQFEYIQIDDDENGESQIVAIEELKNDELYLGLYYKEAGKVDYLKINFK